MQIINLELDNYNFYCPVSVGSINFEDNGLMCGIFLTY